jgi:Uma2 family endonuclease
MASAHVKVKKLTLEEFVRLYDAEGPFEIVNGERVMMSPVVIGHNEVAKRIFAPLLNLELKGLG